MPKREFKPWTIAIGAYASTGTSVEYSKVVEDMRGAMELIAELWPDQIVACASPGHLAFFDAIGMLRLMEGKPWAAEVLVDPVSRKWEWSIPCPEVEITFTMVEGNPPDPYVVIDKVTLRKQAEAQGRLPTNADLGNGDGRI